LNETMGITLLVVTSSPGGSYSNWWCSIFNADLALSVTMTAISTVVSIVTMPLNLLLYSKLTYDDDVVSNLDWASLFTSLIVVMAAIVIGLVCSAKVHSHRFNKVANKLGNVAGILLVLFSIAMSSLTGESDSKIWNRSWHFYLGIALPCLLGLLLSNLFTTFFIQLVPPERVTVSVEGCYQNVGIATSVALTMFDGNDLAEAMGVPLYYGLVEAVVLGVYCVVAWKAGWTKCPPDVPFHTMVIESYEVICEEQKEVEAIEISLRRRSCTKDVDVEESVSGNGDTLFAYYKYVDSGGKDKGYLSPVVEKLRSSIELEGASDEKQLEIEMCESETTSSRSSESDTNLSGIIESNTNLSGINESNSDQSERRKLGTNISEIDSSSIDGSEGNKFVINASNTHESEGNKSKIHASSTREFKRSIGRNISEIDSSSIGESEENKFLINASNTNESEGNTCKINASSTGESERNISEIDSSSTGDSERNKLVINASNTNGSTANDVFEINSFSTNESERNESEMHEFNPNQSNPNQSNLNELV